jgi:hypothetical protein
MAEAVEASGLSRDQVVDRMNDLADRFGVRLTKGNGQRLTLKTLEKWLNKNDTTRVINVKSLGIFCAVTGGVEPLRVITEPLEWQVIGEQESKLLAWAKEYHRAKEARQAMKKIEAEL